MVEVGGQILRHLCHLIGDIRHPLIYVVNLCSQVSPLSIRGQSGGGTEEEGPTVSSANPGAEEDPARVEERRPNGRMGPGSVNRRVSSTHSITPIFSRQFSSRNFMSKAKWRFWF